jgi:hypothetical protein
LNDPECYPPKLFLIVILSENITDMCIMYRKSGSTENDGHYTLSIWQHSNEQQNFTNLN